MDGNTRQSNLSQTTLGRRLGWPDAVFHKQYPSFHQPSYSGSKRHGPQRADWQAWSANQLHTPPATAAMPSFATRSPLTGRISDVIIASTFDKFSPAQIAAATLSFKLWEHLRK